MKTVRTETETGLEERIEYEAAEFFGQPIDAMRRMLSGGRAFLERVEDRAVVARTVLRDHGCDSWQEVWSDAPRSVRLARDVARLVEDLHQHRDLGLADAAAFDALMLGDAFAALVAALRGPEVAAALTAIRRSRAQRQVAAVKRWGGVAAQTDRDDRRQRFQAWDVELVKMHPEMTAMARARFIADAAVDEGWTGKNGGPLSVFTVLAILRCRR